MNGFKNLFVISLILFMCFATACGPGPDGTGPGDGDGDTTPEEVSAMLNIDLPDGVSGEVVAHPYSGPTMLNDGPRTMCDDDCSLELDAEGPYTVELDCPGHIFFPKDIEVTDGDEQDVAWDPEGADWGVEVPAGRYRVIRSNGPADYYDDVATVIEDGQIKIIGLVALAIVTGETFSGPVSASGYHLDNGVISVNEEGRTILSYDNYHEGNFIGTETLTFIE